MRQRHVIAVCLSFLALSSVVASGDSPDDVRAWKRDEFGQYGAKTAMDILSKGNRHPMDLMRQVYADYMRRLNQSDSPFNGSLAGRAQWAVEGTLRDPNDEGLAGIGDNRSLWTCADHSQKLAEVMQGALSVAGFEPRRWSVKYVVMEDPTLTGSIGKGVNYNHVALVMEIDGAMLVFDPWMQAYEARQEEIHALGMQADNPLLVAALRKLTPLYNESELSAYNGMPIYLYEQRLESKGYTRFWLHADPFAQTAKPEWRNRSNHTGQGMPSSYSGGPRGYADVLRGDTPPPARAHWRLVSVAPAMTMTEPGYSGLVICSHGALFGEAFYEDGEGIRRGKATRCDYTMTPFLFLTPGDVFALDLKLGATYFGPSLPFSLAVHPSTTLFVNIANPGPGDMIDNRAFGLENGPNQITLAGTQSYAVKWTVSPGADDRRELRISITIGGCLTSACNVNPEIVYTYEWIEM